MNHDKAALRDALNTLITDPDAKHLYASLVTAASAKTVHPVYLGGSRRKHWTSCGWASGSGWTSSWTLQKPPP